MTEYLLKKDGYDFYKFELDTTYEFEQELYNVHQKRLPILESKSQDMIYENRDGVDRLVEKLVHEKFTCVDPLVQID